MTTIKKHILMEQPKVEFKPISMKCNQQQFDAIKPILEKHGLDIEAVWGGFDLFPFLTNHYGFSELNIGNLKSPLPRHPIMEEWNQDLFLRCCGIEPDKEIKFKPIAMKTYNIKISDLKKIHDVACATWKSKIKALIVDPFAESIELSQTQVDEMFKAARPHQRPVLVEVFGEPVSQCPYEKCQLIWVWDTADDFPSVRKFLGMDGSKFKTHVAFGSGTTTWDNAAPFNNGQLPEQFKHLLENQ